MIIGIGVDLCVVARLDRLVQLYGDRVLQRLFTPDEQARCRGPRRIECLAGRFAVKEAGVKALGTGLSRGIRWRDLETTGGEGQRPGLLFHRRARDICEAMGGRSAHVSISHDGGNAVAVVVLEGVGP